MNNAVYLAQCTQHSALSNCALHFCDDKHLISNPIPLQRQRPPTATLKTLGQYKCLFIDSGKAQKNRALFVNDSCSLKCRQKKNSLGLTKKPSPHLNFATQLFQQNGFVIVSHRINWHCDNLPSLFNTKRDSVTSNNNCPQSKGIRNSCHSFESKIPDTKEVNEITKNRMSNATILCCCCLWNL